MDEVDIANRYQEQMMNTSLRNVKQMMKAMLNEQASIYCEDCGEIIPEQRRQAVPGCKRCIACQMIFEGHSNGRNI